MCVCSKVPLCTLFYLSVCLCVVYDFLYLYMYACVCFPHVSECVSKVPHSFIMSSESEEQK